MEEVVSATAPLAMEASPRGPYAPGWVDRLQAAVAGLPVPSWLFYTALGALLALLEAGAKWLDGTYPVGDLDGFHVAHMILPVYVFGLLHFLDDLADRALDTFRSVLTVDDAQYRELRYRLTTVPALPALLSTVAGILYTLLPWNRFSAGEVEFLRLFTSLPASVLEQTSSAATYGLVGYFVYHTYHQLRMVDEIYTRHTRIDLFKMGPLFALSRLSALTAAGLMVGYYFWWAAPSGSFYFSTTEAILFMSALILAAVITFVWPLLGAHRLLAKEKSKLQAQNSAYLEGALAEIHRRLSANELESMDKLKSGIDALIAEQSVLEKLPTWPWRPGTLGLFGTAIGVPLLLTAANIILQRLFS